MTVGLSKSVEKETIRIKKNLKASQPVDPEFIIWKNIGFTKWHRFIRKKMS